MAIISSGSFVAVNNKIAGTTLAFTSSQIIQSGQLGVLVVATDNLNTTLASNVVTSVIDNSINYNFRQGTGFNTTARTIISQSDGKLLVGGDFTTYNNVSQSYIARLNTDGTLDTTFVPSIDGTIYKLAIQPNVTGSYYGSGVWVAGGNLITARSTDGAGTQNAALAVQGSPGISPNTEEYDGTSWAAGTDISIPRFSLASFGTQNAAAAAGGGPGIQNLTDEYDGTTWTSGGTLLTARACIAGAGTQNAGLAIAGNSSPLFTAVACTEEYNGATWIAGGVLTTARVGPAGVGTQNSALAAGGNNGSGTTTCTEEYNGTSWTAGGTMILDRQQFAGAGTQNGAVVFGGFSSPGIIRNRTERYDGTSWSTSTNLITTRYTLGGAGNQDAALAFGGFTPSNSVATEEFSSTFITCISDKIIAAGTMTGGAIRLNPDGSEDISFNIGTGFNAIACTVIVQPTDAYVGEGIWTAGGVLITAKSGLAGAGTQNEALAFGGFPFLSPSEEYNGTSWTGGGTLITGRFGLAGAGTQNAALAFSGDTSGSPTVVSCTEEYNGTSWVAGNSMSFDRCYIAGAGTQNAALGFGGFNPSALQPVQCTEEYDGTTWTSGGNLINRIERQAGFGTQNAALSAGGFTPLGEVSCTEEYNGTTWVAGGALITGRYYLAGFGIQNSGLVFGGRTPFPTNIVSPETEIYNGNSWSVTSTLTTARVALAGSGTETAGLATGGESISVCACTEEYIASTNTYYNKLIFGGAFTSYNGSTYSGSARIDGGGVIDTSFNIGSGFNPVDVRCYQFADLVGTWVVGGALINTIEGLAGAGTQNEALAFGGTTSTTPQLSCTEEYNGTNWTAGGAMTIARYSLAGAGTQNEALAFGGNITPNGKQSATEEYNGTSWIAGGDMTQNRANLGGAGTQNAGLAFGGETPTFVTCTEEYNGISWATGGGMICARIALAGAGTQNAGLAFGGVAGAPTFANLACTEEYDGSVWIAGGALINTRSSHAGAGSQNAGLAFGGTNPGRITCTEEYNGSTWAVGGALITARSSHAGAGSQNAGLAFGGSISTSTPSTCTEEYSKSNLLAVGNFTSVSGSTRNRIALLNANSGDLIPTSSFNMGSAGFNNAVNSIAIQSDNEIVAVGNFTQYSGSNINRITRINPDGTLDTAFSASIGAGLNAEANTVETTLVNYAFAWTAGGALITARTVAGGLGTQNAGLTMGGNIPGINTTEEYNGATWAGGGNLTTARYFLAGAGTQNAGLAMGGFTSTQVGLTEEYNGTSWAGGGALINARYTLGGAGTQNLALAIGGVTTVNTGLTEEYNGTAWAAGGALITARQSPAGAGTQNAGLAAGGFTTIQVGNTEEYNGTTWAAGGVLSIARWTMGSAGTQNAGTVFGGNTNPVLASCTELYDGSVWSTNAAMITPRWRLAGAGDTQNAALAFGGETPATVTCTEEFSPGTTTANTLLVGGTFTQYAGTTSSGSVRILESGSKETSFAIGAGFGTTVDVKDFYIHSDNSIIAIGSFTTYSGSFLPQPNRIVKINNNGSINASSTGNTWVKLSERSDGSAAAAGATVALFYLTASYNVLQGTTITATLAGSVTARAATGWVYGTDRPAIAYTSSVTSSQTAVIGSQTLSNLTSGSGEFLFVRGIAAEADTPGFTPTLNFSTMSAAGTTGGAAITNMAVRSEFRIVTTSSLVSNPSINIATSNASIYYVFYESAVGARGRTYFILLD